MNKAEIACYLCRDASTGEMRVTLGEIVSGRSFNHGKLFTIKSGANVKVVTEEEYAFDRFAGTDGEGLRRFVEFEERPALAARPRNERQTFWDGIEPSSLPAFGTRIGQTCVVCSKCCKKHGAGLELLLHKEYDIRLGARYDNMCRRMFEHGILVIDHDRLQQVIDEEGDGGACDEYVVALREIDLIAQQPVIVYNVKPLIQPIIDAFRKGRSGIKRMLEEIIGPST